MATGVSFSPEPPASPEDATVTGEAFWPSIDVNHFRDTMRVAGTTIPHARMEEALLQASLTVDTELAAWRLLQIEAGHDTLADVPSSAIGQQTRLTLTWRRAVYHYAAADLAESHADLMSKPTSADRNQEVFLSASDYRRNATHAVRDILGVTRTAVELI